MTLPCPKALTSDKGQQEKEPAEVLRQVYSAGHRVPSGHVVLEGSVTIPVWIIGRDFKKT